MKSKPKSLQKSLGKLSLLPPKPGFHVGPHLTSVLNQLYSRCIWRSITSINFATLNPHCHLRSSPKMVSFYIHKFSHFCTKITLWFSLILPIIFAFITNTVCKSHYRQHLCLHVMWIIFHPQPHSPQTEGNSSDIYLCCTSATLPLQHNEASHSTAP